MVLKTTFLVTMCYGGQNSEGDQDSGMLGCVAVETETGWCCFPRFISALPWIFCSHSQIGATT